VVGLYVEAFEDIVEEESMASALMSPVSCRGGDIVVSAEASPSSSPSAWGSRGRKPAPADKMEAYGSPLIWLRSQAARRWRGQSLSRRFRDCGWSRGWWIRETTAGHGEGVECLGNLTGSEFGRKTNPFWPPTTNSGGRVLPRIDDAGQPTRKKGGSVRSSGGETPGL
jgi:hypothetical protein